MRVGYTRISKKDQNPDLQRRELEAFGYEKVFEEQISSRKADRPKLRAALDYCREGAGWWFESSTATDPGFDFSVLS